MSKYRIVVAGDYPEHPPTIVGGIQAVIHNTLERLGDYDDLDLHVVTCEKWRNHPVIVCTSATRGGGRFTISPHRPGFRIHCPC